jgi:hypothetical protein
VKIRQNEFRKARDSAIVVLAQSGKSAPVIVENEFRQCEIGVLAYLDAIPNLGNLGNPSLGDDGGNIFHPTNTWHIRNLSSERIKAENNDFGTTVGADIEAKVYDKQDDPQYGRVDFDPLVGGISPTGAALALTSLSAIPARAGGAQIVFGLSTSARVAARVLNVAGRPVATICHDRVCDAGLNTLVWDGLSERGLGAPAGVYLVEVSALGNEGQRQHAVTRLRLTR